MKTIKGNLFREMLASGAANLNNHHQEIDALNVFPVPDGDTGTNMSMTFNNGTDNALNSGTEKINELAKLLSKGLLMGARGNSGVITSQIFRGFYQVIKESEEITVVELADALENGAKVAYKAVMKPVEGTILTVIREASWYAKRYVDDNPETEVEEFMRKFIELANESLESTPDLLPVLKEVGVVDSGGKGLVVIFEGFMAAIDGNPIQLDDSEKEAHEEQVQMDMASEEYGYCTEFIIKLNNEYLNTFNENKLRSKLSDLGDSLVVVQDEEIVKVHVHTLTPGDALNIAQRYGEFLKLKIENMQEQHNNIIDSKESSIISNETEEYKEFALVAVCAGSGLEKIFKEYRVDKIISGGQTMNPSTEDFIAAIENINAKEIFILPNNSNIILAAKQAESIIEDKNVHVIETKSIAEGLSACIMFNPDDTVENNINEMTSAKSRVSTGQVTYAIKDTTFEGLEINNGDYMGLLDKKIVVSLPGKMETIKALLTMMMENEDAEILTVISGEEATDESDAEIVEFVEENSDLEIDLQKGDQPVYSYIFGLE
jgi:DAK2 domain fusion protein YloV